MGLISRLKVQSGLPPLLDVPIFGPRTDAVVHEEGMPVILMPGPHLDHEGALSMRSAKDIDSPAS